MNNETGEFTYDEVVVWFQMPSKRGKCKGLAECAEEYAQRLVTTRRRRREKSRVVVARRTTGILVLHEAHSPQGAGEIWVWSPPRQSSCRGQKISFDGGSEVMSRVRRGVLSLRVVRQMLS